MQYKEDKIISKQTITVSVLREQENQISSRSPSEIEH